MHMSEGSLVESSHPSPRRPPPPGARPGAVCAGTYQRRCRRRCHSRAAGIEASTTRVRSPSHHGGRRVVRDGVPHPIPTPPWAESPPKAQIKHEDGSAGKESDCRALAYSRSLSAGVSLSQFWGGTSTGLPTKGTHVLAKSVPSKADVTVTGTTNVASHRQGLPSKPFSAGLGQGFYWQRSFVELDSINLQCP